MTRTAVLHLGGKKERTWTTGVVARILEDLTPIVVVSSEEEPRWVLRELEAHGIPASQLHWHYEAWDTVSQFTLLWPFLRAHRVRRLVVVSDLKHVEDRARRVARAAYLFRGIEVIVVPHLGGDLDRRERRVRVWFDELRALVWRLTGWLWYERGIRNGRMPAIERWGDEAARLPGMLIR